MSKHLTLINQVPNKISRQEIFNLVLYAQIDWSSFKPIKKFTNLTDETMSNLLNINVKTLRNNITHGKDLPDNTKEFALHLLTLYKHGVEVFGDSKEFNNWLHTTNFFFDGKVPYEFLKTVTGIMFIDDRLTALEYGDNV